MRTTLTLDPDVARLLEEAMHRQRRSLKAIVNDSLRAALAPGIHVGHQAPYRVEPHDAELLPGFDPRALNRLADELEDEATHTPQHARRSITSPPKS